MYSVRGFVAMSCMLICGGRHFCEHDSTKEEHICKSRLERKEETKEGTRLRGSLTKPRQVGAPQLHGSRASPAKR